MTAQLLGVTYATAMIPGTDSNSIATAVGKALNIGTSSAADFVSKVLTAYDSEANKNGPYTKASVAGEKMALRISSSTGISPGLVRQTLREMEKLAAMGKIDLSLYNPQKYSVEAKAKQAAKDAASLVKKAAKKGLAAGKDAAGALVPDFIQKGAEGAAEGFAGLGDVARLLPLVVVGGGILYAVRTMKE